jgi:CheY-like chemotaxis protein
MLTNLVVNAVDAMPTGGTLTLSTWQERDRVVVAVADTGTGMTPAVRERCLEPFFSTKGDRGTGLGLAMVFGIVQRHGGTIDIETEPGRGTTFLVRLPVHRAGSGPAGAPAPGPALRPLRVLVVDDEPQIRDVLTALLMVDGHQVGTVGTGVVALDLVRAGGWDVVITDKAMPDLTGDEVAAAVKDADPRIGVVLITGFGSFLPDEPVPHVDMVLPKPVTLPELRRALRAATRGS